MFLFCPVIPRIVRRSTAAEADVEVPIQWAESELTAVVVRERLGHTQQRLRARRNGDIGLGRGRPRAAPRPSLRIDRCSR